MFQPNTFLEKGERHCTETVEEPLVAGTVEKEINN